MQAGAGAAACAANGAAGEPAHRTAKLPQIGKAAKLLGAHLIKFNAQIEKRFPVARIADVGGRRIVGRQRIGQHADPDAALPDVCELLHHAFAGYEIGRHDQQVFLRLRHQCQQPVDGGLLRILHIVGVGGNFFCLVNEH